MIDVNMGFLIDIYGDLLTQKQKMSMELFYNDDCSLAEIATELNISRQGVHENIKQGSEKLKKFEEVLKVRQNFIENKKALESIEKDLQNKKYEDALKKVQELRSKQ